jgi:histidine phosphotransfer protein HptB
MGGGKCIASEKRIGITPRKSYLVNTYCQTSASMNPQEILPINLDHLHQLSEGDTEFELELLQVFVEDTEAHLEAARSAIAANDYKTLEREVHQIKGASGNVGAEAMQVLALELERQAQKQELINPTDTIDQIEDRLSQVKAFMATY